MRHFKNVLTILLTIIFISSIFLISSCTKKEPETIKIGMILPLTGNLGIIGEPEKKAALLALDEITASNELKNKKLEIVFEDTQGKSKYAISAAQKLVEIENVKILIVSTSPAVMSIKPYISTKEVIMFGITAQPDITDGIKIFRISPHTAEEMEKLAAFCKKTGIKRIAFLYPNNELGVLSKKYFVQFYTDFGKIEFMEEFSVGQKDFKPLILKLKKLNLDWILFQGYPGDIPNFIKQARELGVKSKFITSMATTWPSTIKALVNLKESPIFLAPIFMLKDLRTSKGVEFSKKYKEKYNTFPNWDAAFTYDTIMIIKDILKKTDSFHIAKFRNELKRLKKYQGVSGPIYFQPNGDVKTSITLVTIKNDKIIPLNL